MFSACDNVLRQCIECGLIPIPLFGVVTWHADGTPPCCACEKGPSCAKGAGKHPRIKWKGLQADDVKLVNYWSRNESPDNPFNWAFHLGLSNVFGLDIDPRNGGSESWAALIEKYGPLPATPIDTVKTSGWHAWFRAPDPSTLPTSTHLVLAPGVEVKWGNNYFVGPPSTHACGYDRTWEPAPWDVPFAPAPSWLIDLAHEEAERTHPKTLPATATATFAPRPVAMIPRSSDGASPTNRARAYVSRIPGAVSGQYGHNATYHVACVLMIDFALPFEDALPILEEWNQTCQPPWTRPELIHKLDGAAQQPGDRGRLLNADRPFDRSRRSDRFAEIDAELARAGLSDLDILSFAEDKVTFGVQTIGTDGATETIRPAAARDLSDLGTTLADAELAAREQDRTAREQLRLEHEATERLRQLKLSTRYCPRCFLPIMEYLPTGEPCIFTCRCMTWDCFGCVELLRERWDVNIELRLGLVPGGIVNCLVIPSQRWGTTYDWIHDKGIDFFRLDRGPNEFLVVANELFPGSTPDSAEQAIGKLRSGLESYCSEGRPITSSHNWALARIEPNDPPKFKRHGEIPRGTSTATIESILRTVDAEAVDVPRPPDPEGRVVRFQKIRRRLGWWTKELKDHLYFCLNEGEAIPFVPMSEFRDEYQDEEAVAVTSPTIADFVDLTG